MAYISATDLTLILPAGVSIGTNTAPYTLAEIAVAISEISAELDGAAAAAGYTVPIVPPASGGPTTAYQQMQLLAKKGVGALVLRAIFPGLGAAGKSTLADSYEVSYRDAIKLIREGKMPLIGAGSSAGSDGRELPRSNYTSDTSATVGVTPTIDMDWMP